FAIGHATSLDSESGASISRARRRRDLPLEKPARLVNMGAFVKKNPSAITMLKPRLAATAVLLCCSAPLSAQSLNDPLLDDLQLPTVLSATRLKQSPAEVPGSMTVIDRQLIRASGARDIPELMRLVPGMMVGYRSGNQMNVN